MFKRFISMVRGVMEKMGLIKQIKNITDFSAVQESEEHYLRIEKWKALYSGYLGEYREGEPFHDVNWTDIDGKKRYRRRESLKMPKVLSEQIASLVFNEKCNINISSVGADGEENDPIADIVKDIFKANSFDKRFQTRLEFMFAQGGLVMKPYYDDGVKIEFVNADSFLPTQIIDDHIWAGVFINQTKKDDKFYTQLEWHDWQGSDYVITNQLYVSKTEGDLGKQVPLSDLYPNLQEMVMIQGLTRPLFVYIKPNIANNFEPDSPLGISIFANSIGTLKSLDIAFDSFQREFVLGKRRIMVPRSAIRTVVDPATQKTARYFDADDEVFISYAESIDDSSEIKEMKSELRVEEHISAINAFLNILAMQTGFSAGTFAFSGGASVQTATQVISENSQTFRTKNSHEIIIEEGIKELVQSILELLVLYGDLPNVPDVDVTVDFDDSIAEDRQANANYWTGLKNAGIVPTWMAIQRILKCTEEQAKAIAEEVKNENTTVTPEIANLFGGNGS